MKEIWEFGAPEFKPSGDPAQSLLDFCGWATAADVKAKASDDDLGRVGRAIDERASILIMHDVHRYLTNDDGKADVTTIRSLRDAFSALRRSKSVAILIAPHFSNLGDGEHDILKIDWPLPSKAELAEMILEAAARVENLVPVSLNGDTEVLARALCGLTSTEATRTLSMAIVKAKALSVAACADIILAVKATILKGQRGLEMIQPSDTMAQVGGLELLKAEMAGLPATLTAEATAKHVSPPAGILFAGPPGTGKTLCAKVAGAIANVPVFIWSVGETFSKYLGESTQFARDVLRAVDAIDNCILVVDEADTQLSQGGEGDNAAYAQVMGMVLTWMQEKTSHVIVIFTSNHPERMREALLERCDQRWFVDYPNKAACAQIINIHLAKRDLTLPEDAVTTLSEICAGKTLAGRDIEHAIDRAHRLAFMSDRDITADDLLDAIVRTKGLAESRPQEAGAIRSWCVENCEPASRPAQSASGIKRTTSKPLGLDL